MAHLHDPFKDNHSQRSGLMTTSGGPQTQTGPTTPQRSFLFFPGHTPTHDPFAPIPSPHNLRVLLSDSERLRMSLQQDLASAQEELDSAQESLASTEHDLAAAQEEIKQRNEQIKLRDGQIKARDNEIKAREKEIKLRDDEIRNLQHQICRLNVHIQKQDVTIKNQSRTIQDPRSVRQRRMEETSTCLSATAQPWTPQNIQSLAGAMQSFSLGRPQQFAAGNSDNTQYYPPHGYPIGPAPQMPYQMSYSIEPSAPPMGTQFELNGTIAGARLQGLFNPTPSVGGPTQMHMNPQNTMQQPTMHQTIFPTPGGNSNAYGATAYSGIEFETKSTDFGGRFRSLWGKIDNFGRIYVVSDELHPKNIPAPLKDYMMLDPNAAIAVKYLNHAMTKPLCIAKVINFYLCKKMLKYTEIIKNLSPSIDGEILNAKRKMTLGTFHPLTLLSKVDEVLTRRTADRDAQQCQTWSSRKNRRPDGHRTTEAKLRGILLYKPRHSRQRTA